MAKMGGGRASVVAKDGGKIRDLDTNASKMPATRSNFNLAGGIRPASGYSKDKNRRG